MIEIAPHSFMKVTLGQVHECPQSQFRLGALMNTSSLILGTSCFSKLLSTDDKTALCVL